MSAAYWLVELFFAGTAFALYALGGGSKKNPLSWIATIFILLAGVQALTGAFSGMLSFM